MAQWLAVLFNPTDVSLAVNYILHINIHIAYNRTNRPYGILTGYSPGTLYLTHWGLVTPNGDGDLGQQIPSIGLDNGLGADQATSHYLDQCWDISRAHICDTRGRWVNWHRMRHGGPIVNTFLFNALVLVQINNAGRDASVFEKCVFNGVLLIKVCILHQLIRVCR